MKKKNIIKIIKAIATRITFFKILVYPLRVIKLLVLSPISSREKQITSNLSNLLVDDILAQVNEFKGKFYISPSSALFQRLALYNSYEPDLTKIVKQILDPHKDIIDIGANIGFYTVLFQKVINKDKKVLAIEPASKALKRLYQNLTINQSNENVIVFEGGVSDTIGKLELKTINGREEYSTLGSVIHPASHETSFVTELIEISTVDLLVKKYSLTPGFVKIDVEGMEPRVLQGMQETIRVHRPIILMEWDEFLLIQNKFIPRDIIQWLEGFGYKLLDPVYPGFQPENNMICIPAEVCNILYPSLQ